MTNIKVKELKSSYVVGLHKVNREIVAELSMSFIDRLNKSISDIDTIELTIPKFIINRETLSVTQYQGYTEAKKERLISLDEEEFYVIKKITTSKEKANKKIVAYSLEHKLAKNDIEVEDIGFYLMGKDEEKGIYSLNDYMFKETGWKFGHIDDSIKIDSNGNEKLRWQESVKTSWYNFLTVNVKEGWDCYVSFDTKNKLVNLYNMDSFGDEVQLCLTYDNFLKELEKNTSSEELVTRLKLVGNEEVDILEATPTGYPYIEDYSYFINNGEMSDELANALVKYKEMVKKRTVIWNRLREEKSEKLKAIAPKKTDLYSVYAELKAKKSILKTYQLNEDTINIAKTQAEISKLEDDRVLLEQAVYRLEDDIKALSDSIKNINTLCKRETSTDDNGVLIFNEELLNELKDYIYYDTYSNDCFLSVDDLIKTGERELSFSCVPTKEWSIDVVNFTQRIITPDGRGNFIGVLGLGNVIVLYDRENDTEEMVYFVGFEQDFSDGGLTIALSNKKFQKDNSKVIGDLLKTSKLNQRELVGNRYLWVQQKKNRINLPYEKGKDDR